METCVNGDLKEETHIQQGRVACTRLFEVWGSVDGFCSVPLLLSPSLIVSHRHIVPRQGLAAGIL